MVANQRCQINMQDGRDSGPPFPEIGRLTHSSNYCSNSRRGQVNSDNIKRKELENRRIRPRELEGKVRGHRLGRR